MVQRADNPSFTEHPHPTARPSRDASRAVAAVLTTYLIWGVVGWFFQIITTYVPPVTLLAHRVCWSLVFLCVMLSIRGEFGQLLAAFRNRRVVLGLTATSLLIATNWMTFIYASHKHLLVEASVGYYLAPLLNVLLGVLLLGERLRRGQILATLLAAIGVAVLVAIKAGVIWIPLLLMGSWSFYALLRKRITVGPMAGLAVETALLAPLAIAYIAYDFTVLHTHVEPKAWALLASAGVVTAMPLILFGYAAPRLSMATLGLTHYLSPTVQFIVAAAILREGLSLGSLAGLCFIWIGLIVFATEGYRHFKRPPA